MPRRDCLRNQAECIRAAGGCLSPVVGSFSFYADAGKEGTMLFQIRLQLTMLVPLLTQTGSSSKRAKQIKNECCRAIRDISALDGKDSDKRISRSPAGERKKRLPCFFCVRFRGSFAGSREVEKAYEVWKQNIYVSKSKKKRFSKILSIFSFLHILTIAILL